MHINKEYAHRKIHASCSTYMHSYETYYIYYAICYTIIEELICTVNSTSHDICELRIAIKTTPSIKLLPK